MPATAGYLSHCFTPSITSVERMLAAFPILDKISITQGAFKTHILGWACSLNTLIW